MRFQIHKDLYPVSQKAFRKLEAAQKAYRKACRLQNAAQHIQDAQAISMRRAGQSIKAVRKACPMVQGVY